MSADKRSLKGIIKKIERGAGRSSLFWYLLENHDDLLRAATGTRILWGPLCEQFAADGLRDAEGKPPSPETARMTWWRVRREVAKRRAAKQAEPPPKLHPSRMPATARPVAVEPPRAAEPRQYATPSPHPAQTAPPEVSQKVRDKLALFDRQLDYRDRYLNPPKRKD